VAGAFYSKSYRLAAGRALPPKLRNFNLTFLEATPYEVTRERDV